jgi:hypothetical protein
MAEEPKNPRRAGRTPWLKITRAVSMAFDVRKLVLGAVALILVQAGWSTLDRMMPESATVTPDILDLDGRQIYPAPNGALFGPVFRSALWRITEPARVLIGPMLDMVSRERGIAWVGHAMLGVVWAIVVLGLVGGAISRTAVSEIAKGDRLPLVSSLRFALRSARALIVTPLLPLVAAGTCTLICAGFGFLYRSTVFGGPLATITFFIPLVLGLVAAVVLIDFAAAWPFLQVSVAADAESVLDALSRAFGYVNRRPLQFAACVAAVWLAGAVGLIAVDLLSRAAIRLAASGLDVASLEAIVAGVGQPGLDAVPLDSLGETASYFWGRVVRLLIHAWIYGYYWSAAAMVYLVLRQDVDGSPMTDIKDKAATML